MLIKLLQLDMKKALKIIIATLIVNLMISKCLTISLQPRAAWLTRHGESILNPPNPIGAGPALEGLPRP